MIVVSYIFDYIKENGNQTFFEKEFTEVDAAILAAISYINFEHIVSDNKEKVKLGNALEYFLHYGDIKEFMKRGFVQKDLLKLCRMLKDKIRYKDILLFGYVYKVSFDEQFCAISMKLPDGKIVISYEGTDHNLAGWEEDMALCYKFPVPSQTDAIRYLHRHVSLFDREVILVGHSKGGHLAMVAGMFANPLFKFKIKKIYNFDGPGLRKKEITSAKYESIEKKLYHIVPHYSLFGLLLRHGERYISVKSSRKDFFAHSLFTWEIVQSQFKREPLSKLSRNLDKSIILWLDQHNDQEREKIAKDIFSYFRKAGLTNFVEIMKLKSIISLLKCSSDLDKETRDMLNQFVKFNFDYYMNNRDEVELL